MNLSFSNTQKEMSHSRKEQERTRFIYLGAASKSPRSFTALGGGEDDMHQGKRKSRNARVGSSACGVCCHTAIL